MTKPSSGYCIILDPTYGYPAISVQLLRLIPLEKVSKLYFFESDILFRLNVLKAKVVDIPLPALYQDEESNLRITKVVLPFTMAHLRNTLKRIIYNYFLRDFNIASIELVGALLLILSGATFGLMKWVSGEMVGIAATPGTVMLAAMPILIGVQLLLAALAYDVASVPRDALHSVLENEGM